MTNAPTDQQTQTPNPYSALVARFKAEYPDCLLVFRTGDTYTLFGDDAGKADKVAGRSVVPFYELENLLTKLIAAGLRVAVCEQVPSK